VDDGRVARAVCKKRRNAFAGHRSAGSRKSMNMIVKVTIEQGLADSSL
jgi:hypothetical protein